MPFSPLNTKYDCPIGMNDYSVLKMGLDGSREHSSLYILADFLQPLWCKLVVDSDNILLDDRSFIQVLCRIMSSCANHLHASLISP